MACTVANRKPWKTTRQAKLASKNTANNPCSDTKTPQWIRSCPCPALVPGRNHRQYSHGFEQYSATSLGHGPEALFGPGGKTVGHGRAHLPCRWYVIIYTCVCLFQVVCSLAHWRACFFSCTTHEYHHVMNHFHVLRHWPLQILDFTIFFSIMIYMQYMLN